MPVAWRGGLSPARGPGRALHTRLLGYPRSTGLAAETGISTSTLSRLEAGLWRPTFEQLLPLARAHGVTLDELVDSP